MTQSSHASGHDHLRLPDPLILAGVGAVLVSGRFNRGVGSNLARWGTKQRRRKWSRICVMAEV
jgi:hypothetical protein